MTSKKRIKRSNPYGLSRAPKPTLAAMPTTWDTGASGQCNQQRLRQEPATDIDPETGRETANPNGIRRHRRDHWVEIYRKQGKLTDAQAAAADKLRMASEGMQERDPIAALGETRTPGGSDPQAARVDARRYFHQLWAMIPKSSHLDVERVVLDDLPIRNGNTAQRQRYMQRLVAGLDAIT